MIVLGIMAVLSSIVLGVFLEFRRSQALAKDTENIVELLSQARNQTISSKNSTQYGVHVASTTVTLFIGDSYIDGAAGNEVINLNPQDTVITVNLNGGGTDVVFDRLTGETTQTGTVVISASGLGSTKTVRIYSTGVVESQ